MFMKERKLDLIDMLVEIFLHWRMFIIWMLIGAVLAGSFRYIQSHIFKQVKNEKILQYPEDFLSKEEIQNVNYVIAYDAAYRAQNTYLAESPVMDIDPNYICRAEATIAITAKDSQKCQMIQNVYKDIVQSSGLITKIAKNANIKTIGLSEVVLLAEDSTGPDNFTTKEIKDSSIIVNRAETFRVIVIYNDETQCQNILETVITFLKEKQPDIKNILGEHDLSIVNQSYGVISDTEIAAFQKTILADLASMKRELATAKSNLSNAGQQYYQLLAENKDLIEIAPTKPIVEPSLNTKYIFFGAIIGIFLYAFILFLIYIFNTKIRFTDNLQELYGIPQLGMIPAEKNLKKLFSFIDKWLLSLRNHNKRQFPPDKALNLATSAVKIAARKEKLPEITFIGCNFKKRSLDICEKIKAQLENDNIQTNILDNVLYDAQAMNELEHARGVVLLESVNSTLCIEIANEIELLKRQGIKILGGILLE